MKVIRADEGAALARRPDAPDDSSLHIEWLEGPHTADRLDVGYVTAPAGVATPPHAHLGGQVMVVTEGRGFVETDGERVEVAAGDVVICPPGELHVHGALDDAALAHLTITTGPHTVPARED